MSTVSTRVAWCLGAVFHPPDHDDAPQAPVCTPRSAPKSRHGRSRPHDPVFVIRDTDSDIAGGYCLRDSNVTRAGLGFRLKREPVYFAPKLLAQAGTTSAGEISGSAAFLSSLPASGPSFEKWPWPTHICIPLNPWEDMVF